MKTKSTKSRAGSVLVLVLILTSVLLVIAGAVLSTITLEYTHSIRSTTWNESLFVAEGGVDLAWNALNLQSSDTNAWSGWTPSTVSSTNHSITLSLTADGTNTTSIGSFTVNAYQVTNDWVIVSTGTCQAPNTSLTNISRQVEIRLTPGSPFTFGLLAKGNIQFNGNNVIVDSYNSTDTANFPSGQYVVLTATPDPHANLKGNVGTDGVSLNAGNGNVYGDLWVGVNGVISSGPQAYVTGSQNTGLQADIPDATGPAKTIASSTAWTPSGTTVDASTGWPTTTGSQIAVTTTTTLGPGDYNISSISLSGGSTKKLTLDSRTGNIRLYVSGDISLAGSASIQILGTNTTHTVKIWVVGNVAVAGNGVVSPSNTVPSDLVIYAKTPTSGTKTVSMDGNAAFKGAIYAPGHAYSIGGAGHTGTVYGSVVANTITMGGNANFHYDEALSATYNSSANWDAVYWRENAP